MELPFIAESARKHGIPDEDMHHAYRNPIRTFTMDDTFTLLVGPSRNGEPLEVGYIDGPVIVHAMPARPQSIR